MRMDGILREWLRPRSLSVEADLAWSALRRSYRPSPMGFRHRPWRTCFLVALTRPAEGKGVWNCLQLLPAVASGTASAGAGSRAVRG